MAVNFDLNSFVIDRPTRAMFMNSDDTTAWYTNQIQDFSVKVDGEEETKKDAAGNTIATITRGKTCTTSFNVAVFDLNIIAALNGTTKQVAGADVTTINTPAFEEVKVTSTIDYVKEVAELLGWDGEKTPENRRFLSDLKDTLTRWRDVPYQRIKNSIDTYKESSTDLLFIDCREPEEIARFVNDYGALTILVQRGEFELLGNHADDNVMNYQYDVVIDNNRGLDELMQEATIFEETFVEEE